MKRVPFILAAALLLSACDDSMSHQPRYGTYRRADLWSNRSEARPLPAGVVAQEDAALLSASTTPPPVTPALLARGHERYDIYCSPCHGLAGDGNGMIVQRGFPAPPSLHSPALLQAAAPHIFDVISRGYGVMYAYGDRIPPGDRWAIVAYIRALQLSRRATVADLSPLQSEPR